MKSAKLLVLDNYDSFTYNLVQMFRCFGLEIDVRRSDRISTDEAEALAPDYLLISPGPGNPGNSGISMEAIGLFAPRIPILGVCLGMQCINEVFGGHTVRAPEPVHGKTDRIHHRGEGLLHGIPSPFTAARYHSLVIEPAPEGILKATCWSETGLIMGLSHPQYPLHGLQFHPESFLTEHGEQMVRNFLRLGVSEMMEAGHDTV